MKKSYADLLMSEQLFWFAIKCNQECLAQGDEILELAKAGQAQYEEKLSQLLAIAERQQARIDYLHRELMIMGWLSDDQSWGSYMVQ